MQIVRDTVTGIIGLIVLWLLAVGLISSPSSSPYRPEALPSTATEQEKAQVLANGLTHALEEELNSFFGFLPNDLITPWFIDNTTYYQSGIIYATRPGSDIISKEVGRFGNRDTVDPRLADATSRHFSYSENVWGFLFVYDAESKYRAGISRWDEWAKSIGTTGKSAGVFNLKSDDVYNIIKYCITMSDFALGVLNDNNISHFSADNAVYYAKGIMAVTSNIFRALIAIDQSISDRGGVENVKEALNRFDLISEFNPTYVVAGGNKVGDAMLPNHVAALARHIDVASNRLNDMLESMSR